MNRWRLLHIGIAAALLTLVVWRTGIGDVRRVLSDVDPRLVAAVIVLNLPIALLFPVRAHFVLRRLGARVHARVLVPAVVLGNVAGALTPASSGELLRTAVLRSHADLPVEDGLALVLYERALSVWILAMGTAIVASFIALELTQALVVAAVGLLLAMLPVAGPWLLDRLPAAGEEARHGVLRSALRRVQRVAGRLKLLLDDRALLAGWSLLTAAIFAITTLQLWLLARSVSHAISPAEAWTAFGASQLAGIASLLPLGLGAADGSLAALLRRMGTTFEQGTVVAILVRATMTLPLGIMAVTSYVYLVRISRNAPRGETPRRVDAPLGGG